MEALYTVPETSLLFEMISKYKVKNNTQKYLLNGKNHILAMV
jgi:hypothetical protein